MSSRNLPHHLYVHVDSSFFRGGEQRFEPAVWFAIRSAPDEAWGCHVMLESGAVYRGLPPHALAFSAAPQLDWTLKQAQVWDCYGTEFDVIRYEYLSGLDARYDGGDDRATCLFTACPSGDGFSAAPDQLKEFMFMRTATNRLLIRPTNMVLFEERSFTRNTGWPTDILTATKIWECETEISHS